MEIVIVEINKVLFLNNLDCLEKLRF